MTAFEEVAHVADILIQVNVELDQVPVRISDILALDAGSVIKTSRAAGENIDIQVGGAVIGSGEIVIIEERVAVRITDFKEDH
jgi:flagellar motor switch protein FliN/FliY